MVGLCKRRHGQDCSEIEGEDDQDKEGWQARVDDEAHATPKRQVK
jgi:hypothetical protein